MLGSKMPVMSPRLCFVLFLHRQRAGTRRSTMVPDVSTLAGFWTRTFRSMVAFLEVSR